MKNKDIRHRCQFARQSAITTIAIFMFGLVAAPQARAAVQMGGHMDFVLSNGTAVRVFPEAMDLKPLKPRSLSPSRRKTSTLPPGGDPCKKLSAEYNKRSGVREKKKKAAQAKRVKPKWVRRSGKLKAASFRRAIFLNNKPKAWYYLPSEPRLSFKNGIPEATFVKFITDETADDGGAEGGLFHMMVTYGLTKEEQEELQEALQEAVPGAVLKGMVDLEPSKTGENFIVTSGTLSDDGFAPTGVLTSGRAPSFGGKAAVAGRLSSLGAQLMEATFENTTSDLSVTFAYDYIVKTQAYKAEVRIDMDRISDMMDCSLQVRDKTKTTKTTFDAKGAIVGSLLLGPVGGFFFGMKKKTKTRISAKDLQQGYETMINTGAVQIVIDQNLPDADVSAIEASLMQMALSSFTSMQQSFATNQELAARKAADKSEADKEAAKQRARDKSQADNYSYFTMTRKQSRMSGVQTFNIEKGVALYRTHSMTGNMGGFIREHKDEIYDEVLLNDPFFKRGVITVDLDTESLDLFEANMINNAAVEVIVPFTGNAYKSGGVFTRSDISSGGIMKQFTFATRGEDMSNKECTYKYIETWSLRGGGKWPLNPTEKCAKEMAVTLVPPITKRTIDVEADLAEMEEAGIRGADVLLRHNRYGKEKIETARFRVAKGEPYLEHSLFVDKDDQQVDYKIVLTHRDKGKFSTDWAVLEDDFVFANLSGLPMSTLEQIREKVPEIEGIIEEVQSLLE